MFLGLDLSLRATGAALLSTENMETTTVRTLTSPATLKGHERLFHLRSSLERLVTGKSITLATIEGYSFGSKNNQFYLGEWGGVARLCLHEAGVPYIVVPPTSLKKWTTGSGNADKIAMAVATYEQFGLKFDDDNQCDAFNLAVLGTAYGGEPIVKLTADRKKILDQIRANPLGLQKG